MKRFSTKKRIAAAAVSVAMVAAGAGVAFAYFTATGSGSASGLVGQTNTGDNGAGNAWSVSVTGDHSDADALYPGSGTASLPFTITNTSPGHLGLTSVVVSVAQDGSGNIETTAGDTGSAVAGCLASWFNVDSTSADSDSSPTLYYGGNAITLTHDIAGAGVVSGTATVQLTNLTDTPQDSCQGATPAVIVSAS